MKDEKTVRTRLVFGIAVLIAGLLSFGSAHAVMQRLSTGIKIEKQADAPEGESFPDVGMPGMEVPSATAEGYGNEIPTGTAEGYGYEPPAEIPAEKTVEPTDPIVVEVEEPAALPPSVDAPVIIDTPEGPAQEIEPEALKDLFHAEGSGSCTLIPDRQKTVSGGTFVSLMFGFAAIGFFRRPTSDPYFEL